MNEGWIKLYTKFKDWEWYKDTNTKIVFIHCLLSANWKDGKFEGIEVPRGSFVTSLKKLSKELGISVQAVRTSINHLISTKELTNQRIKNFRVISVNNYNQYQVSNKPINRPLTNLQQTFNKLLTTIEDNKNIDINTKKEIYSACAREGIVFGEDGNLESPDVEIFEYDWLGDGKYLMNDED